MFAYSRKIGIVVLRCAAIALLSLPLAHAQQIVKVGGYDFPPFIDKNTGNASLTLDLIAALNAFQKKYTFEFVETSSKRRFINFDERKYDLIFFEALEWGWQGKEVEASKVIMHGGTFISRIPPRARNS